MDEQERKKAVKEILFKNCVTELDLIELNSGKAVTPESIRTTINSALDQIAMKLGGNVPNFSVQELEQLEFRLGQRRVNVKPEDKPLILKGKRAEPWLAATEIDWRFWENYRGMLQMEGKSPEVISNHELAIEQALELTGDPRKAPPGTRRRGLVMGNVQSGKTLNFIGLINKALDAGYHTVIVLGGHMNELRAQAQGRVNAGVVDIHKSNGAIHKIDNFPHSLTTVEYDFSKANARSSMPNLVTTPAVYVVKKHHGILKRLEEWFSETGNDVLTKPLLLIDDEADYASINTKQSLTEFTSTNVRIRKLLSTFEVATYVAYTATPFANVFIPFKDQQLDQELDSLYPADFMIKMPIPDNYVGQDFFFKDVRESYDTDIGPCRFIDSSSHEEWLPIKHKKDFPLSGLHPELRRAILCFVNVIAVRATRGQTNTHNTMLVNVSRFNLVQQKVALDIQEFVQDIKAQLRAFAALPIDAACQQSSLLSELKSIFETELQHTDASFTEVLQFYAAESPKRFIKVEMVNGSVKTPAGAPPPMDYAGNEDTGLWVIAVGGLKLSRGLTLEGLSVSYFYRNALAYDTLTQMCRWFGYRDNYQDLCRLYLLADSYDHYYEVASAIRTLYEDLRIMGISNGTPRDFGMKVKNSDTALLVTARNKMGTGVPFKFSLRLWAMPIYGLRLPGDNLQNDRNREILDSLITKCIEDESVNHITHEPSKSVIYQNASYEDIVDYIERTNVHFSGRKKIRKKPITNALNALKKEGFPKPTVILMSRMESRTSPKFKKLITEGDANAHSRSAVVCGHTIQMPFRSMQKNSDEQVFSKGVLVSNSNDLNVMLSSEDIKSLKLELKVTPTNKHFRERLLDRPVLVLYVFRALLEDDESYSYAHTNPTIGYVLHFPAKRSEQGDIKEMETEEEYIANEVLQHQEDMFDEDHENVD